MLKNYIEKNKLPWLLLAAMFLLSSLASGSLIEECLLEENLSSCCFDSGVEGDQVTLCGCKGKPFTECTDLLMRFNCEWRSNLTIEKDCAEQENAQDCFSRSTCNWMADYSGNTSCFPLLCEDRSCESLEIDEDRSACSSRPDCMATDINGTDACITNPNCACGNPDNLFAYCPCLTKTQCESHSGCNWNEKTKCQPAASYSSASTMVLSRAVIFLSLVAALVNR